MTPADISELFHLITVSHLLHLLAVAFAVDLAYITLEPFRYTRRVYDLYESADIEIKKFEERESHGLRDSALLTVRSEKSSLKTKGLGPCIGFKNARVCRLLTKSRALFGTKTQSGWDIISTSFCLTVLFCLIILAAVKPDCFQLKILDTVNSYNASAVFALFATCLPVFFIFFGYILVRHSERKLVKVLNSLREAHNINIDIDAFQKNISDFSR